MSRADAIDPALFQGVLPEGCGVVVYARSARAPWTLRLAAGDGPGVLGVPTPSLARVWDELVSPADEPKLTSALASLGEGGAASLDYRVRTALGAERWVRDSFRHHPGAGGGAIVGTLHDVSLERTLREQIAALEERIWKAQRVDSLGALAAGIAHDLGNLLTAILSAVQLAEAAEGLPAAVREDLTVARESARRGSEFVKQILRFASREEYRPGLVDVNGVVEDLRIILGRSLGATVRLEVVKDPGLPLIYCDPGQVEQVLLNLAVNARDAMPVGGQLTISTRHLRLSRQLPTEAGVLPPGDYVALSVADNGRGIPAQAVQRIFEPFFSTKARSGSGSGLGLSTVDRIVKSHGGGVRVESVPGEGTTFHIYLPVRRTDAPALPEVAGGGAGAREAQATVLVAQGDESIRELIRRVLVREGFSVIAVRTAADALRLFDRVPRPVDALVTDLLLPDRSGVHLVRLLRNRVARLPTVYVVDYATSALLVGPPEGEGHRIEKPFTPQQLVATLRQALDAGRDSAGGANGTLGA